MEYNYKKPLTILLWLLVIAVAVPFVMFIIMMILTSTARIETTSSVSEVTDQLNSVE